MRYVLIIQSLLSSFVLLTLGEYVYLQKPKEQVNRVFGAFCLLIAYWTFTEFMYRFAGSPEVSYLWARLHVAASAFVGPMWLHFTLAFTENTRILRNKLGYVALYGPAIMIACLFSVVIVGPPVYLPYSGVVYTILDSRMALYLITLSLVLLPVPIGVGLSFYMAMTTNDEAKREQAKYVTMVIIPPVVLALITAGILPALRIQAPHLSTIGFLWTGFLSAFAVSKYELFAVSPERAARNIISTMTDSLVLLDADGCVLTANKATSDMLGYDEDELIGKSAAELFADAAFAERLSVPVSGDGSYRSVETSYRTKDGHVVPVLFSSSVVRNKGGEAAGIVGIAKDITERKVLEEALWRANDELEERVQQRTADLVGAERELERVVGELRRLLGGVVEALSSTTSQRDPYTALHQERVARLACAIAEEMGLDADVIDGLGRRPCCTTSARSACPRTS